MTALLHQPTHATAELHWLAEQVRIETDQRNFGGSWRSLRAARSDRHDLADREGPTRTMADQGGVTEDSRRNGPRCGDLPTVVGAIWRTNVRTPAQHYRHPDPCMCDCSLTGWWDCSLINNETKEANQTKRACFNGRQCHIHKDHIVNISGFYQL